MIKVALTIWSVEYFTRLNRLVEHREAGGPLGTLDIDPANGYPFPADQPLKSHYRYDGQYSASDNPMAPPAGPGNMTYKGGLELYYECGFCFAVVCRAVR